MNPHELATTSMHQIGGAVGGHPQPPATSSVVENANARCGASGVFGWPMPVCAVIQGVNLDQDGTFLL